MDQSAASVKLKALDDNLINNMADLHNVFISHYGEDEKQLDSLKQNLKNHGCDARNSSVEKKDYDNKRHSDAVIARYLRICIRWAKTFMLQKGPLGEDRLRGCTESSKHGRMFICFVALILASYIRHLRDSNPELAKAFPSMSAILEEMQTIRCIEHDGRRKFITPFVGDQLLICDAFGFEIPEGCRPTYTSKKSTKGKRGRPPKPQTETS